MHAPHREEPAKRVWRTLYCAGAAVSILRGFGLLQRTGHNVTDFTLLVLKLNGFRHLIESPLGA